METFVVWLLDKAMLVIPEKKRMAAFNYLKKNTSTSSELLSQGNQNRRA